MVIRVQIFYSAFINWEKMIKLICAFLLLASLVFAETNATKRSADQTYLTYPEWFLVFSPEEYAYYLKAHPSYTFDYMGHIEEFWSAYAAMYKKTLEKKYPFNTGYHVMIMTIGVSTTFEYLVKYFYGHTIGQFVALTQTHDRVSEQNYGAQVAQEYVDFIKNQPWYEFDFEKRFVGIYTENSFFGKDFLRKMERKEALSIEYGAKYLYAKVIAYFTEVGYKKALPLTQVVLVKQKQTITKEFPRYDKFKDVSLEYAKQGYDFKAIAGNDANSSILYSLLGTKEDISSFECLLRQPITSNKVYERCINDIEIKRLAAFLREKNLQITDGFLPSQGSVKLEHIFDF